MSTSTSTPTVVIPPHIETLLIEQVIACGRRQELIKLLEIEAHGLRQQLRAADSSPLSKPGGTPSIPLSASTARTVSPASSGSLDVSIEDPSAIVRRQLFDTRRTELRVVFRVLGGGPQGTRGGPQGARGSPQGTKGSPQGAKGGLQGTQGGPRGTRGGPRGTRGVLYARSRSCSAGTLHLASRTYMLTTFEPGY